MLQPAAVRRRSILAGVRAVRIAFSAAIVGALIIGAVAAYATLGPRAPEGFKAVDITGVAWGHGFELTDHHGQKRTLADFRGKVVLVFFGYTGCTAMYPTSIAHFTVAMRERCVTQHT